MPFCCAGHVEIPDMGKECPVDIIFDKNIIIEETIRQPKKWMDSVTSYIVCKSKQGKNIFIYDFYHLTLTGHGHSFRIEYGGRETKRVEWRRPQYQWVRIEITETGAKFLNKAFKTK
jgi:hypothetical protein